MNVTVSVFGRFHAFYLARELQRRGHLLRLITSHPRYSPARWGVSKGLVRSLWPLEVGRLILRYMPASVSKLVGDDLRGPYEQLAARCIPKTTDLFVGWSSTAERGIERARELGARTIVERGSSHIRTQRELLREEYQRHGLDPVVPSTEIVEKEEREYEAADYVAVPSDFAERTFRDQGVAGGRLLKIPYGVDPLEFRPVEKEDDNFRVIFAGQISLRKGIHYLLEAWRDLDLPGAELLLLGPVVKEFEPWMDQFVDYYRHPGSVPQDELYRWYSQGSVFVLPSVEDGFGMVLTQAMACGLPLIATAHTGAPDLIREGEEGFLVPVRDVEALKERLVWCYEHREACRAMGWLARQRVLKQFTWQDYGRRLVNRYGSVFDNCRN